MQDGGKVIEVPPDICSIELFQIIAKEKQFLRTVSLGRIFCARIILYCSEQRKKIVLILSLCILASFVSEPIPVDVTDLKRGYKLPLQTQLREL